MMFGLTANQSRFLAAAVAAFLISGVAIIGNGNPTLEPWVVPLQTLIGAIAGALGWSDTSTT